MSRPPFDLINPQMNSFSKLDVRKFWQSNIKLMMNMKNDKFSSSLFKSLANRSSNTKSFNDKSRQFRFIRKTQSQYLMNSTIKPKKKISLRNCMRKRRRSIDLIKTSNCFERIIKNDIISDKKSPGNTTRKGSLEHLKIEENTNKKNNYLSHNSMFKINRSSTFTLQNKKKKVNFKDKPEYERIIALLKTVLAPSITGSVFLKDFITLYLNYRNKKNSKYMYRSSSNDTILKKTGNKKLFVLKTASFKAFILNLYTHHNVLKRMAYRSLKTSNIVSFNRYRDNKKSITDLIRKSLTNFKTYEIFDFKFLQFNKDAKEFCHAIKFFNKHGYLEIKRKSSVFLKPKVNLKKRRSSLFIIKNKNVPFKKSIDNSVPVNDIYSASLFQKMISIGVDKEKMKKSKENKTKFNKSVKKAVMFFNVRKAVGNTLGRSKMSQLKKAKEKEKKRERQLNSMYNVPRILSRDKIFGSRYTQAKNTLRKLKNNFIKDDIKNIN